MSEKRKKNRLEAGGCGEVGGRGPRWQNDEGMNGCEEEWKEKKGKDRKKKKDGHLRGTFKATKTTTLARR